MTVKNKQIDGQLLNEVLESSDYLEMNKFLFQCYGARLWTPEKINLTDAQISRMEQLATATPSALRIYDIYLPVLRIVATDIFRMYHFDFESGAKTVENELRTPKNGCSYSRFCNPATT